MSSLSRRLKKILLALLCLLAMPSAQAVYKCKAADASTIYSDLPCNGKELEIEHTASPAQPTNEKQQERQQAELARLQSLRELRERQDQHYRQMTLRGQAAKQKKCRALELQKKWKEEDAAAALLPAQTKARRAARRAAEKYQMECG